MKKLSYAIVLFGSLAALSASVSAHDNSGSRNACRNLPGFAELRSALIAARNTPNGGLNNDMWASVVNRDGIVCAVVFTGAGRADQWPGSRVISAQKANTANSFSLSGFALSTANLYAAVQPGGSLYGLSDSNPVDTEAAYKGPSENYGASNDPLVGKKIGGVNTFGGGLPLYNGAGVLLGAIGVSGDTSCADHNIAWKTRDSLGLDHVPNGVNPANQDDNIIYDFNGQTSASGFGHPACSTDSTSIANSFPKAGS